MCVTVEHPDAMSAIMTSIQYILFILGYDERSGYAAESHLLPEGSRRLQSVVSQHDRVSSSESLELMLLRGTKLRVQLPNTTSKRIAVLGSFVPDKLCQQ